MITERLNAPKLPHPRLEWLLLAAVVGAGYLAFQGMLSDRARTDAVSAVEDSAYAAKLKKYLRDSTVLDSLTKLVQTDSLYRLYRQALQSKNVDVNLVAQVWCEELRLTTRHGIIPADRAINRLRDTVYRDIGVHDAFDYLASRAPDEGHFNSSVCGELPPPGPRVIDGTSTDIEPRRPPPRRK